MAPVPRLPPPADVDAPIGDLVCELAHHLGVSVLAEHDLPRVRVQAMRALASVGDTEHISVVEVHLEGRDATVRQQAARASDRIRRRVDLV